LLLLSQLGSVAKIGHTDGSLRGSIEIIRFSRFVLPIREATDLSDHGPWLGSFGRLGFVRADFLPPAAWVRSGGFPSPGDLAWFGQIGPCISTVIAANAGIDVFAAADEDARLRPRCLD
jgi:hypothetical protein